MGSYALGMRRTRTREAQSEMAGAEPCATRVPLVRVHGWSHDRRSLWWVLAVFVVSRVALFMHIHWWIIGSVFALLLLGLWLAGRRGPRLALVFSEDGTYLLDGSDRVALTSAAMIIVTDDRTLSVHTPDQTWQAMLVGRRVSPAQLRALWANRVVAGQPWR